jgi:hypothetical protein
VNTTALVFLLAQIRLLGLQIRDAKNAFVSEQERVRKQATIEYLAATSELRRSMSGKVPPQGNLDKVEHFIDEFATDPQKRLDLHTLLNYYEEFAAAVNRSV